jgi:hypothetical protein
VVRASSWPAPNDALTPGAVNAICPTPRVVSANLRSVVLKRYSETKVAGSDEFDHRIPKFLCGADDSACPAGTTACAAAVANIWYEKPDGYTGHFQLNRKDQLEDKIYLLWHTGKMPTSQAVAVFARPADWRAEWCQYVHTTKDKDGVDCRPWNTR